VGDEEGKEWFVEGVGFLGYMELYNIIKTRMNMG
jgi:hypothetical protein